MLSDAAKDFFSNDQNEIGIWSANEMHNRPNSPPEIRNISQSKSKQVKASQRCCGAIFQFVAVRKRHNQSRKYFNF